MERPEYVNTSSNHSIETWGKASLTSQEWAESARLAAIRRRKRKRIIYAVLAVIVIAILAAELLVGLHFKGWL